MPISTKPLGVFVLYTATDVSVTPNVKIESALDGSTNAVTSTNYFSMTDPASTSATVQFEDEIDGLGSAGARYGFTFTASNPIPDSGTLVIDVPSGITVPSSGSDLTLACTANCDDSLATVTPAGNVITITNMFSGSYVSAGATVEFSIKGFTNPTTTAVQEFTLRTEWTDENNAVW